MKGQIKISDIDIDFNLSSTGYKDSNQEYMVSKLFSLSGMNDIVICLSSLMRGLEIKCQRENE